MTKVPLVTGYSAVTVIRMRCYVLTFERSSVRGNASFRLNSQLFVEGRN